MPDSCQPTCQSKRNLNGILLRTYQPNISDAKYLINNNLVGRPWPVPTYKTEPRAEPRGSVFVKKYQFGPSSYFLIKNILSTQTYQQACLTRANQRVNQNVTWTEFCCGRTNKACLTRANRRVNQNVTWTEFCCGRTNQAFLTPSI